MQVLAFSIGAAAFAGALRIALVVAGSRRDRIGRFLIPSPLFVGSPMCGVVLSLPQQSAILALASLATVLAAVAMVPLLIMVCALVLPTKRLWKS